jgi:hypothetical protein
MIKLKWGPPTFIIAITALVLSLGGTSFALTQASGSPAAAHPAAASAAALTWHNLTLKNGWVNGGFGSYAAAYSVDSQHVVHLRGSAASGSGMAFRMPNAVRPSHTLWLSIYAFNGSSGGLEIEPNGAAFLFDNTGSNSDVTQFSSLDGVTFAIP